MIDREQLSEDKDNFLNGLFADTSKSFSDDGAEDIMAPAMIVDMDAINKEAFDSAEYIVTKLANYMFDQEYIQSHPTIEPQVMTLTDNIRRLKKLLTVNEIAQDALIRSISLNGAKGALYTSLTALQQATLSIQKQLDDQMKSLEDIFLKMQESARKTFDDKDKEQAEDGSVLSKGARDFLKQVHQKRYVDIYQQVDTRTGEVLSETQTVHVDITNEQSAHEEEKAALPVYNPVTGEYES